MNRTDNNQIEILFVVLGFLLLICISLNLI
ncbi:hypothetical protein ArsFIN_19340 [Arsenophonus nasoniae]|uniref:Uncharacterized protein n=1 Tax=Arsenophonus nasoniae TaxID=638 RepID=A0A4P7KTA2_9GAMM|nr:hypothetical protein ArsFIN_19340 [Arsenophonus nasoniae]